MVSSPESCGGVGRWDAADVTNPGNGGYIECPAGVRDVEGRRAGEELGCGAGSPHRGSGRAPEATTLLGPDLLDGLKERQLGLQQAVDRLHEPPLQRARVPGAGRVVGPVGVLQLSEHATQALSDALDVLQAVRDRFRLLTHADQYQRLVEIYFSILQRKVLTLADLGANIIAFQAGYQEMARPFEWKFTRADLDKPLDRLSSLPQAA